MGSKASGQPARQQILHYAMTHHVLTHQEWAAKLQNQPPGASSAPAVTNQRMAKPFGADLDFHFARIAPAADAAQPNVDQSSVASSKASDAALVQAR